MRKLKKIGWIALVLLLVPILAYIAFPKGIRCLIVQYSSQFELFQQDVYVSIDTPESVRDSLSKYLAKAEERNKKFWRGKEGRAKIIYTHTSALHATYGIASTPATVFYTPFRAIMVVGSDGVNLDVLSHELCHAELYHRLGWWRKQTKIPTWFDEGLAMQLDYRPEYNETAYVTLLDTLSFFPDIKTKATPQLFWEGGIEASKQHYILARHEVRRWLRRVKRKGLYDMIDELVENGTSFEELYDIKQ